MDDKIIEAGEEVNDSIFLINGVAFVVPKIRCRRYDNHILYARLIGHTKEAKGEKQ